MGHPAAKQLTWNGTKPMSRRRRNNSSGICNDQGHALTLSRDLRSYKYRMNPHEPTHFRRSNESSIG